MWCIRIDLMCRQRPSMHASCSRRASLCLVAAACIRLPTVSVPLNTRAPLVRDLTSVPAARPTMGWHGQAKQPMLQSALSVLAVVTDAQEALHWTDAATRVWAAAVWPRSMWSGSSAQLASKLVWRPPRHGVWPVPCSQGHVVYELGPEEVKRLVLSVCRRAGAGQEPRAGPQKFGQNPRSRRRLLVATCAPAYDPN